MNDPKIVNLSDLPWSPGRPGMESRRDPGPRGSWVDALRLPALPARAGMRPAFTGIICKRRCSSSSRGAARPSRRPPRPRQGRRFHPTPRAIRPHTFVNSGAEPMSTATAGAYEVCEYPEEGTVYVEAIDKTLRNEDVPADRAMREAGLLGMAGPRFSRCFWVTPSGKAAGCWRSLGAGRSSRSPDCAATC